MMRKIIDKIAIFVSIHQKLNFGGIGGVFGESWGILARLPRVRLGHAIYLAGIKFTLVQFGLVLV